MPTNGASTPESIVRPRMPELDTIRGVAILLVLFFHGFGGISYQAVARPFWQRVFLQATRQGWVGVNLFFVLSGFLITGILLDSVGETGYYRRFYWHRALRILPAYYLMLTILLIANYNLEPSFHDTLAYVGLSTVYLSNLAPLFGVFMVYPLLWSLSVEEHFYLLWPTVVRIFSRKGVAIVAGAICVIEPVLRLLALSTGRQLWWSGVNHGGSFSYTWMTADGLALGALLGLFARSAWGRRDNFSKLALIAAMGAVAGTAGSFLLPNFAGLVVRDTLVNYFGLAIVAGALWVGTGKHRGWVNVRLLSFYGFISYGLYLVHGWVFAMFLILLGKFAPGLLPGSSFGRSWIDFLVCAGVATSLAYGSRITYEQFFLRLKDRRPRAANVKRAVAII